MKCIQYSEHGGDYASTFQCIETETSPSDPPASFALVKVHAAAGNPIDFKVAKGELNGAWDCPLPMIMGYDFSGVIAGVGEGSDAEFQVGDEVFAVTWGQVNSTILLLSNLIYAKCELILTLLLCHTHRVNINQPKKAQL